MTFSLSSQVAAQPIDIAQFCPNNGNNRAFLPDTPLSVLYIIKTAILIE